jgi:hypothetical protein
MDAVKEDCAIRTAMLHGIWIVMAALGFVTLACGAPLAHWGFDDGLGEWVSFADGAATADVSTDRPAVGRKCARLAGSADDEAMLVSPPLPLAETGKHFDVQLRFRADNQQGLFSVGVARRQTDAAPEIEQLWRLAAPADSKWHLLRLAAVAPHDPQKPLCLTLRSSGGGEWSVDDVQLLAHVPPSAPPHEPMDKTAIYPEPLEDDWEPDGLLDARKRTIGQNAELIVDVAGLQISIPEHVTCPRGFRTGIDTYCSNRGTVDKVLEVRVQGPSDMRMPEWSVPVAAKSTLRLRVPVQRLLIGDCWVKISFGVRGEYAAAALRLHSEPAYPAFGVAWPQGRLPAVGRLQQLRRLGAGMARLVIEPTAAAAQQVAELVRDGSGAVEYLLAPLGGAVDGLPDALLSPQASANKPSWSPHTSPQVPGVEAKAHLCRMATSLYNYDRAPNIFSLPYWLQWDATEGSLKLPAECPLAATDLRECLGRSDDDWGVQSLVLNLPPLPGAALLDAQIDGHRGAGVASYWADFNRRTELAPIRAAAHQAEARLPFTVLITEPTSSADRRLDALKLGRAMVNAVSCGSTAVLVPAVAGAGEVALLDALPDADSDPVARAFTVLAGELAGATAVLALEPTDTMSSRPDAQVTYRLFLRGDEGIAVMWNNTSSPVEVAAGLRSQPVSVKLLRLAYYRDFIQEEFQPVFKLSAKAKELQQPGIYMRLDPLDITVLSMRLVDPGIGWLRGVFPADEFSVRLTPKQRGPQWWERLFF